MASMRFLASSLAVCLFVAAAGCATETGEDDDEISTNDDELKLVGIRYLGRIFNGETRTTKFWAPPRYRSYGFDAKGGDDITVEVKSIGGDAIAYITDSKYNVLAWNDDAERFVFDAKVRYTVPQDKPLETYRIVFADYAATTGTFSVSLTITSPRPPVCTYGTHGYYAGDEFMAADGCNTRTCGPTGAVTCTKKVCACDPAREPWRTYKHTPQECITLRPSCVPPQFPFSNPCGCGCESPRP